jgi:iron-sulfur cluster repair protein YtfE (RIC family)
MELAQEELFAHFEYEEVTLFPFLIEKMPDCRESVAELELAHDRMCGVVSRMSHMLGQGDEALTQNFDAFVVMFARFDANFVKHAREEWELLQRASTGLSEADRRTLAAAMEGH